MGFCHSNIKFREFRSNLSGYAYSPLDIAKVYGFPAELTGKGKKIGLIELGGNYSQKDYDTYRQHYGLSTSQVVPVSVDGGKFLSDGPNGADGEVMLDLCVAGLLAPEATIAIYMAPNSDNSFVNALKQAVKDGCDAVSVSWGQDESGWPSTARNAMADVIYSGSQQGIVFPVAAGDNGSSDGQTVGDHADFPASYGFSLACGGTSLAVQGANVNETVWNNGAAGGATGGGISKYFTIPTWQPKSAITGGTNRGVPDVAGVADPGTGWQVIIDGQMYVIGGTSAVAPMWAAIAVLLQEGVGRRILDFNQKLYQAPAGCFRDITIGNNGTFIAKAGYDLCTGLGTPNVTKLLAYFKSLTSPKPLPVSPLPPAPPYILSFPSDTLIKAGNYNLVRA